MKCQILLFSGKNKRNITNVSSAELAQRVVKVNWCDGFYRKYSKRMVLIKLGHWKSYMMTN